MAKQTGKSGPRALVIPKGADDEILEAVPLYRGRPGNIRNAERQALRKKFYALGDAVAENAKLALAATLGGVDPLIETAVAALEQIEPSDLSSNNEKLVQKALAALHKARKRKAETPDWGARLPTMELVMSRLMPKLRAVAVEHRANDATVEAINGLDHRGFVRILAQLMGAPQEIIDATFTAETPASDIGILPAPPTSGRADTNP